MPSRSRRRSPSSRCSRRPPPRPYRRSTNASPRACSCRPTARLRSGTSSRGSPSRRRWLRTGSSPSTARRSQPSEPSPRVRPTSRGSPITRRRPREAESVLELAPPAGARASALGAHREAAAQYARALRFAGDLPLAERADLLLLHALRVLRDHAGRGRACVEPGGARGAEAAGRPDQAARGARLRRARRAQHGSRAGRGRGGTRGRRAVRGDGARVRCSRWRTTCARA